MYFKWEQGNAAAIIAVKKLSKINYSRNKVIILDSHVATWK